MEEILLMFDYLIFLSVLQDYNAIWSPELLFILAYHVYSLCILKKKKKKKFIPYKLLFETTCSSTD